MNSPLQQNKAAVIRFNSEVIENGSVAAFKALVDKDFINRTAPPGAPNDAESLIHFFNNILRPAFPDLKVIIHDQVAENDKVTTRKSFHATHLGEFMGIPATKKSVVIDVIDIVRLRDGKYLEHWGMNNLPSVVAQLAGRGPG